MNTDDRWLNAAARADRARRVDETRMRCLTLGLVRIWRGQFFGRVPDRGAPFVRYEATAIYLQEVVYEAWVPRWLRAYLGVRRSTERVTLDELFSELEAATPDEVERIEAWMGLYGGPQ